MEYALTLARMALGRSSPNPAVGAVVVKDGIVVGEGHTQRAGSWHAEIMALLQAGASAKDATLYVTLEPCCHFGRTPPCTQAIIAAGVREVHFAILDPNPLVCGRGQRELEAMGIRTFVGGHEQKAGEINEAFFKYINTGLPFVIAKYAMTLDGKIATRERHSRWITGEIARQRVHGVRDEVDAVMVGVNTILADDPQLTARVDYHDDARTARQPLRIVVDSQGRVPLSAQLFRQEGAVLIAATEQIEPSRVRALQRLGAEVLVLPAQDGRVPLGKLFGALGEREVTSVLVEGGGTLLGALFEEGLVDKIMAFVAPVIVGGKEAPTPVAGWGVARMSEAWRLNRCRIEQLGEDFLITGYTGSS
ncbi:MAG: bifunctional diaminohydroxyphosphoribosylaminopyrimidine deaminase/5-amino-6-(5-phosphoribosylamino)uracil reductase RibD [Chloroflexi bacterium]|nr:bifunctional diaminohydroxyphosphoribosylaminopyrimidine deaminase/5-amino-6-(5-phosphoribosylamino)uracil reductase RibD [Chloroflexota bacterium]